MQRLVSMRRKKRLISGLPSVITNGIRPRLLSHQEYLAMRLLLGSRSTATRIRDQVLDANRLINRFVNLWKSRMYVWNMPSWRDAYPWLDRISRLKIVTTNNIEKNEKFDRTRKTKPSKCSCRVRLHAFQIETSSSPRFSSNTRCCTSHKKAMPFR